MCAADYYGPSGLYNCTRCPANSWTNRQVGSTWCVCKDRFYRAPWESVYEGCSGKSNVITDKLKLSRSVLLISLPPTVAVAVD